MYQEMMSNRSKHEPKKFNLSEEEAPKIILKEEEENHEELDKIEFERKSSCSSSVIEQNRMSFVLDHLKGMSQINKFIYNELHELSSKVTKMSEIIIELTKTINKKEEQKEEPKKEEPKKEHKKVSRTPSFLKKK